MELAERIRTVAVTATLTSAVWIVVGATILRPPAESVAPTPAQPAEALPLAAPLPAASAPLLLAASWIVPVADVGRNQLVDTYTQSRADGARLHEAIDIAAPRGTPVLAATGGTVEKLFLSDDGGKTIYIRLPGGRTMTYYAHLDAYAANLHEGMAVRQGQVLGTVGSTGNASPEAPHLHFAVSRTAPGRAWHDSSEPINPYPLLTRR